MLRYTYDPKRITLTEEHNGQDTEFYLTVRSADAAIERAVKHIRDYFERNDVLTDVLFYAHHGEGYQWIVRQDFYTEFVLALFKHRLLTAVRWEDASEAPD